MEKGHCVLALSDIFSSIGWNFKSNFDEVKDPEQVIAAKKLAIIVIVAEIYI